MQFQSKFADTFILLLLLNRCPVSVTYDVVDAIFSHFVTRTRDSLRNVQSHMDYLHHFLFDLRVYTKLLSGLLRNTLTRRPFAVVKYRNCVYKSMCVAFEFLKKSLFIARCFCNCMYVYVYMCVSRFIRFKLKDLPSLMDCG